MFRCRMFAASTTIAMILSICSFAATLPDYNAPGSGRPPKNIIILIADGCGFNHVDAVDYWQSGRLDAQTFEDFPVQFAVTTYAIDGSYDPNRAWASFDYVKGSATDSAAAATAIATGVKTYSSAIGVSVTRTRLPNVRERAEQLGKATGVVTSVPFTHATPAAFVAHNTSRNRFGDIAAEMLLRSNADVIMGCGNPNYDDDGRPHSPANFKYVGDPNTWDALTKGTLGNDADGDGLAEPWKLIQARGDFQALMTGPAPERVFGAPQVYETLQANRTGDYNAPPQAVPFITTVPTLAEMTRGALNVLDADPDGLFLMVEGGAVDWAASANRSGRTIEEVIGFAQAVDAVIDWVEKNSSWDETLVIVTADHETGYLTGPGSGPRPDGPVWNPIVNNGRDKLPGMQWNSTGHTNSLVPFFAKGLSVSLFKDRVDGRDSVRGDYIDNTDIGGVIFSLWPPP